MTVLTDSELHAIKARCEAATPGPWESVENTVMCGNMCIAICFAPAVTDCVDAEFVARARADIPALLAHIEHLQRRYTMPCPYCDFGSGQRGMDRCPHCDGTGRMDVHVFVAQQRDAARAEVEGLKEEGERR